MAITPIDDTALSVDTADSLKTVLAEPASYPGVTTIYLTADFTLAATTSIDPGWTDLTIDGKDPVTGVIHALTDYPSSGAGYAMGVRTVPSAAMVITYRNIDWTGQNWYGIFYTPDNASYNIVTIVLDNITYIGPQTFYHAYGSTRILNSSITTIQQYSTLNEVGEVSQVELGGTTTLTQTSTAYPIFWFRDGSSNQFSLTILPGSDITINAGHDVAVGSSAAYPIAVSVGDGAHVTVTTATGFSRNNTACLGPFTIGDGASFLYRQSAYVAQSFYCSGALTVGKDAVVDMRSTYNGAGYLLNFYSGSALTPALILNDPKLFLLYKSYKSNSVQFSTATEITITAQQVNTWATPGAVDPGTLTDEPDNSWRKSSTLRLALTGTSSSALTGNLSAGERARLPDLGLLSLTAPVFSAGMLPLCLNPISNEGGAVTGVTDPGASLDITYDSGNTGGTAGTDGSISVDIPATPEGSVIKVSANTPFLYTRYATDDVDEGEFTLTAPDTVAFLLSVIATEPAVLYGRSDPSWAITVTDTRIRSRPWSLRAAIDGPLTSSADANHTVPNALAHVDERDNVLPLSTADTVVYTGSWNAGDALTTAILWEEAKGLLLQATTAPYFNGEEYTAQINWTIADSE